MESEERVISNTIPGLDFIPGQFLSPAGTRPSPPNAWRLGAQNIQLEYSISKLRINYRQDRPKAFTGRARGITFFEFPLRKT